MFFKGRCKKEELWPFEPPAKVSIIVDKTGEPQLKLYPPAASEFSASTQKDMILAMAIVGEYLENLGGKNLEYSLPSLQAPQLIAEIKGRKVHIVIKTSRYPESPTKQNLNQLSLSSTNNNHIFGYASVELWPAGKDANGCESFFINFRGIEKIDY